MHRMHLPLILLALGLLAATPAAAQSKRARLVGPKAASPGGACDTSAWRLVFHDEFDGAELDRSNWITWFPYSEDGSDRGEGCRVMGTSNTIFRDDLVSVADGRLRLGVRAREGEWYGRRKEHEGGMVHSMGDARFTYGRFEVRCRIPKGTGLWPAFWVFGGGSEIDAFEFCGEKPQWMKGALHRWDEGHVGNSGKAKGEDLSQRMHVYAMEWDPEEVRWYLDGRLMHWRGRFVDRRGKPLHACGRAPGEWHTAPYFPRAEDAVNVILDLAISEPGGFCRGPKKPKPWPDAAVFEVDYVRVYQRRPHPALPDPCAVPMRLAGPDAPLAPGGTATCRIQGAHGATDWKVSPGLEIVEAREGAATVRLLPGAQGGQWVQADTDDACGRTAVRLHADVPLAP